MVEGGCGAGFLNEASAAALVGHTLGGKNLERDQPAEARHFCLRREAIQGPLRWSGGARL
jgi:hypothetical protein